MIELDNCIFINEFSSFITIFMSICDIFSPLSENITERTYDKNNKRIKLTKMSKLTVLLSPILILT